MTVLSVDMGLPSYLLDRITGLFGGNQRRIVFRSPPEATIDLDTIFDVLSVDRRRWALILIAERETTDIGTIADHIAATENNKPSENVAGPERKRVYIALHQTHLPKLDQADIIDWDEDRGTIEPDRNLWPVLEVLRAGEPIASDQ